MQLKGEKTNRVYRMRSLRITGISIMMLYDLLAVVTIIHNPTPKTVVFQVVAILFATVLLGRLAWLAVLTKNDGLHVINMFSSFDLEWSQIERFEVGRAGIVPGVCRIYTKGGKICNAFGISESNYSAVRGEGVADRMVGELSKELSEYTRTSKTLGL